ncbi:hypothetical protein EBBID32_4110 [Sphingobium indicum BiD32]|uniref:Uncharacterized protein n=1 Tax=Sphingobium indicum BiD32 TaxID=1301087 RepID=N1MFS2_9SPHN|nr:hypothetical protein EBBID32_4110 [Sphingobium indicum BiD32]
MLHDVAVGPFAEQPAGKIAPPFAIGAAADVQLHEGTGFLHIFPRRAGFAGLKPHDRVAHAQRLARLHRQIAGQAVALVEQADHSHTLRHRRAGQGGGVARPDWRALHPDRAGLVGGGHVAVATGGQRQQGRAKQDRQASPRRTADHDASGLHAS